ncbi:PIN domain nuclease [Candidatus Magnetominusculus dajiuhuensis]|uniref:PIN domain nuclease n=1 Tax=Candidatus Magnetominusculus dajiuhuensis TaxID=3137712 RepID=UPI003B436442
MKKIKLYLDTSVPSFLFADDSPEKMEVTVRFWDILKLGLYDIVVSDILLAEISRSKVPSSQELEEKLTEIVMEIVSVAEDIYSLVQKYIAEGIIPQKYQDDALHIALATYNEADALISWNFKHMVKLKTIRGVNGINRMLGFKELEILTPQSWIQEDNDE